MQSRTGSGYAEAQRLLAIKFEITIRYEKDNLLIFTGCSTRCLYPETGKQHGAASDSGFTHIAINTKVHLGATQWYAPVTEEEYNHK